MNHELKMKILLSTAILVSVCLIISWPTSIASNNSVDRAKFSPKSAINQYTPGSPHAISGIGQINLTWNAVGDPTNLLGYIIYRGNSSGTETLLANIGTGTTYSDSNLQNFTVFYYKIQSSYTGGTNNQNSQKCLPASLISQPLRFILMNPIPRKIGVHVHM